MSADTGFEADGCAACDGPLGPERPSPYFCKQACHSAWHSARSDSLYDWSAENAHGRDLHPEQEAS